MRNEAVFTNLFHVPQWKLPYKNFMLFEVMVLLKDNSSE